MFLNWIIRQSFGLWLLLNNHLLSVLVDFRSVNCLLGLFSVFSFFFVLKFCLDFITHDWVLQLLPVLLETFASVHWSFNLFSGSLDLNLLLLRLSFDSWIIYLTLSRGKSLLSNSSKVCSFITHFYVNLWVGFLLLNLFIFNSFLFSLLNKLHGTIVGDPSFLSQSSLRFLLVFFFLLSIIVWQDLHEGN